MKVITFSKVFPTKHPKKGEPTFFVQKILHSLVYPDYKPVGEIGNPPKFHTIRAGLRWKVGEQFSPRIWSGKPYQSKQQEICGPLTIRKIWPVEIYLSGRHTTIGKIQENSNYRLLIPTCDVATNDGLECDDFIDWFNIHPKKQEKRFIGQILCWSDHINY